MPVQEPHCSAEAARRILRDRLPAQLRISRRYADRPGTAGYRAEK
jgi:hypothetical protein